MATIARSELILGGQKSGKSRRAEALAAQWLAIDAAHRAVLVATATAADAEMRERIERHRRERSQRVPELLTVEEPLALPRAIEVHSAGDVLLVVDCLTLWLSNRLFPPSGQPLPEGGQAADAAIEALLGALAAVRGPIVLVSNEIGLGVIPLGPPVRAFVDALGTLNQRVAAVCERVTWMVAGLPMMLKGRP